MFTIHMVPALLKEKKDGTVVQINSPPCVHNYNANMGAVDKSDQLWQSYAIDKKSRKWWRRLFHFLLDLTMVTAYNIYCQHTNWCKIHQM